MIADHLARPIRLTQADCEAQYPKDVLLNAVQIGAHLFCHKEAARELIDHPDFQTVTVRQGYAKCSTIPVGDKALITSDRTIAGAARRLGMDVLSVNAQGVVLSGYDHGLIGGCASYAPYGGTDTILFIGSRHFLEWEPMVAFCNAHGKELIPIGSDAPLDVGTIFLI